MTYLSFFGLIRTFLIVVLFLYVLRLLGRIFLPLIFKSNLNSQKSRKQRAYKKKTYKAKDGGDVTINIPIKKPKDKKDFGEYIDYKEVKDNDKNRK